MTVTLVNDLAVNFYYRFSSTRKTRIHGDFGFAFPNTIKNTRN